MWLIFVFCLLGVKIVGRSVESCEVDDSSNDVASTSLRKAGEILDLYNQKLVATSSWQDFHRSVNNLETAKYAFPSESQTLVRDIISDLRASENNHARATASISSWCQQSSPQLRTFIGLLDGYYYDPESIESQKLILINVLKRGVEKMNNALDQLSDCISHLNSASGDITQLDNQVESARRSETSRLESDKNAIRDSQWIAFIFPPLGATLTLVNELDTIPRLDKRIGDVHSLYRRLNSYVKKVENEITSARNELRREIITLDNLQCQANVTRQFVELSYSIKFLIKRHANNLIGKCQSYITKWANHLT